VLGPQWPPFALVPESHTTETARELAEFSAMYGQPNDPWQTNVLEIGCGETVEGNWAAQEVLLATQRQNGKGGVVESRGLGGLYLLGERLIYYTAHNIDTAKMTFDRCVELVTGFDDLRRRVKRVNETNSQEAIELVGGAEFRFRTRGRGRSKVKPTEDAQSGGKGRGFSCDCLFLDEALYLQQDALDALGPTMLARPNPQIWYLSTPPVTAAAALMKIRDDGLAGVPGMAMAMWANPHGADLSDERVLAFGNPAWGIRLNLQVMAMLRRRLGDEGFARECGGIWPEPDLDNAWRVIPKAAWEAQCDPRSQLNGRPAYGVWVPPDRSMSAIGAAGARLGGGRHMEITGNDEIGDDYRPGTAWVVPRLKQLERHEPLVVVIDDEALAKEAAAAGLAVHRADVRDMVTGCQLLYDGVAGPDVEARDLFHRGQKVADDAIKGAEKRNVGGSWAFARSGLDWDVTAAASMALALAGAATPRLWRVERRPGAAFVASVPHRASGPRQMPAAPEYEDVTQQRLREQLERDLARR
jgi:hypothetical protein